MHNDVVGVLSFLNILVNIVSLNLEQLQYYYTELFLLARSAD